MKLWMMRKHQERTQKVTVTREVIEKKSIFSRMAKFVKTVVVVATRRVVRFFVGCWQHAESIVLLLLASYGINALLSLLPFMITLPLWVEFTMVIPFIAVCIVLLLTKSAEWRATRRMRKAMGDIDPVLVPA